MTEETNSAYTAASTRSGGRFYALPIAVAVLIIALDQYFKYWVKHNMLIGEQRTVFHDWFHLYFIENNGMAFGFEFGGSWGKYILTFFRILAVVVISWYMFKQIKAEANRGFILAIALILAGALGNIIDSVFYGIWYSDLNDYAAGLFNGRVVDMLYFPIIHSRFPEWVPVWGGEDFIFFRPIFNIADVAISTGVIAIILFQKRYFPRYRSHRETSSGIAGGI